eukprot:2166465-Alexandrium_andersonii.AAC.1
MSKRCSAELTVHSFTVMHECLYVAGVLAMGWLRLLGAGVLWVSISLLVVVGFSWCHASL